MKKIILLCLGFLCLVFAAQAQDFQPTKDMVAAKDKTITLKVGQVAYAQYKINGSTGLYGEAKSEDETVLKTTDTFPKDNNKSTDDNMIKGSNDNMIKGSDTVKTVVFTALKKGKTVITIQEMFRGEVKQTHKVQVIVK